MWPVLPALVDRALPSRFVILCDELASPDYRGRARSGGPHCRADAPATARLMASLLSVSSSGNVRGAAVTTRRALTATLPPCNSSRRIRV
jgi:hypothetical protein